MNFVENDGKKRYTLSGTSLTTQSAYAKLVCFPNSGRRRSGNPDRDTGIRKKEEKEGQEEKTARGRDREWRYVFS